ncbi:MAG TPA: hypothetical protein VGP03_07325, partial [Pseudonocardiaceae bacterium]|nr:hypothetical protein [Pseudonocardiaceae bacterium]
SWLFSPALILVGGSALIPVYTARYLSFCAPAAALLMAVGLEHVARHRTRAVAAGLLIVIGCAAPVWLSQRDLHAKNHSDLTDTSAIIASHASPGDAVVFDENVRPSRRPRLALHVYPQAFAGLRDITLDLPYTNGTSWHDTALPIPDAVAAGRFRGVNRVWYIDYSIAGEQNVNDRAAFAALGYTPVHEFTTVRSVVTEYEFNSAQRAGAHG